MSSDEKKQNILITGASGLIGPLLAARLLQDPQYRVFLTDVVPPQIPAGVAHPENATCLATDLCDAAALRDLVSAAQPLAAAFVLHGIMSAGSEADPGLALRVNVDATRALLTHLSEARRGVRVVFASSNAVYGPPLPALVSEATTPTPTGTYGACKYMVEILVNDLHRRGCIDAFSVRFPTVAVRPGRPTAAASSFFSGIVREPMNGLECVVPLRDRSFRATLCSPRICVENLLRVLHWKADVLPPHIRSLNFPGIVASVQDLRDALAKLGGEDKLKLIREEPDEVAERLLRSWAWNLDYSLPLKLGLAQDESAEQLVREYIESLKK